MIYSRTDTLNLAKADGRDWNSEAALVARTRIDKPAEISYEEAIGLGLEKAHPLSTTQGRQAPRLGLGFVPGSGKLE
jgi:hypothetical protein